MCAVPIPLLCHSRRCRERCWSRTHRLFPLTGLSHDCVFCFMSEHKFRLTMLLLKQSPVPVMQRVGTSALPLARHMVPTLPVIRSRERRTRADTLMAGSGLGKMSTTHTIIKIFIDSVAVSAAMPQLPRTTCSIAHRETTSKDTKARTQCLHKLPPDCRKLGGMSTFSWSFWHCSFVDKLSKSRHFMSKTA